MVKKNTQHPLVKEFSLIVQDIRLSSNEMLMAVFKQACSKPVTKVDQYFLVALTRMIECVHSIELLATHGKYRDMCT